MRITATEALSHELRLLADSDKATPCQGKRSERWTSDEHEELEWAAFHCRSMACPLLATCGEAADETKTRHHVYGGVVRSTQTQEEGSSMKSHHLQCIALGVAFVGLAIVLARLVAEVVIR